MSVNWRALQEHFPARDLEFRVQQAGKKGDRVWALVVPYVTNRAIMQRLDDVCGPENWRNEFKAGPDGGVLCGIAIRVGEEWVTKWDGAENTDVEPVKGGISSAMKRAAVQWGLGRILYQLDEMFANVHPNGAHRGKTRDGDTFRWDAPELPAWAVPNGNLVAREHEAMLDWIREQGARLHEEATLTVAGAERNVKTYIRENWPAIKEQYRIARAVVEALEPVAGAKFQPPV
jgi:hypothetical protein